MPRGICNKLQGCMARCLWERRTVGPRSPPFGFYVVVGANGHHTGKKLTQCDIRFSCRRYCNCACRAGHHGSLSHWTTFDSRVGLQNARGEWCTRPLLVPKWFEATDSKADVHNFAMRLFTFVSPRAVQDSLWQGTRQRRQASQRHWWKKSKPAHLPACLSRRNETKP